MLKVISQISDEQVKHLNDSVLMEDIGGVFIDFWWKQDCMGEVLEWQNDFNPKYILKQLKELFKAAPWLQLEGRVVGDGFVVEVAGQELKVYGNPETEAVKITIHISYDPFNNLFTAIAQDCSLKCTMVVQGDSRGKTIEKAASDSLQLLEDWTGSAELWL